MIVQPHPVLVVVAADLRPPLLPDAAPLPALPPPAAALDFLLSDPPGTTCSGVTATLTGVACVWKTGSAQSSSVRESGMRMPLPMQISRIRSPPEQSGSSESMIQVE